MQTHLHGLVREIHFPHFTRQFSLRLVLSRQVQAMWMKSNIYHPSLVEKVCLRPPFMIQMNPMMLISPGILLKSKMPISPGVQILCILKRPISLRSRSWEWCLNLKRSYFLTINDMGNNPVLGLTNKGVIGLRMGVLDMSHWVVLVVGRHGTVRQMLRDRVRHQRQNVRQG
ncbi:hypothetical protein I3842_01G218400 [Carya illinoinensis]|uniref:Uncharacterized protein n=1 Tax=Carya illinoinensis TaxID=32201 RepID=A0A922K9V9_CARIL|nr:hypothetical protein I3842_01G218400 [Carya illinoinensis]